MRSRPSVEESQVLLSIIIVSWNTCDLLDRCLQSISRAAPGFRFEVWVVDNASHDNSAAFVRERFPSVHLIENMENVGFARANNQAIREATGRYIVLLNSDTEVCPGAIENLVRFMDLHPSAAGCGPRLLNSDGSLQASCHPMLTPEREFWRLVFLDQVWPRATYIQEKWDPEIPRRVEVIKGACFLLRGAALDQVGHLDEQYFMYTEEVDLCYRLARAGLQLWWVPEATVIHYGEASSSQMAETMYVQLYRSKVQFYRKFGGAERAARFKRLVQIAYRPRLIVASLGAAFSRDLAIRFRTYRRLLAELPNM